MNIVSEKERETGSIWGGEASLVKRSRTPHRSKGRLHNLITYKLKRARLQVVGGAVGEQPVVREIRVRRLAGEADPREAMYNLQIFGMISLRSGNGRSGAEGGSANV